MPSSNYEPTDSDEENLDDDESEDYLESESDDEDPDYFETASPSEGTNGHQQSVAQQKQVMIIKRREIKCFFNAWYIHVFDKFYLFLID